ncbi:hypothetical protein KIN20_035281 [Parelaphostrongylus tenuis]|uniref:Uncharacterized protein n=1 Tax=Parelaphostrongylus tenuis TaxID=148309 RepID=A0AAD5WKD4_PARTN|nr:hypothetical protein KIN20_035281 [Parelaphostrongylus tenuis]
MIYVEKAEESARVSGIAANKGAAQAFVQRLVMQTVFDVLESQARSAFLPDPIISTILGQLTVNITYEPLQCQAVALALSEKECSRKGRPTTSSTSGNNQKMRCQVLPNPERSMRKMAREIRNQRGGAPETIVKNKLKLAQLQHRFVFHFLCKRLREKLLLKAR